ncbi:MAG: TetR/AcrR family transcriptional regulator [Aeromicrobium sp.]
MERTRTARERARDEITAEILAAARRRLASDGPGALSLRAVARDVGMVSSAVYRYVPSRDELLTALLIEAYDELGAAAESADDAVADRSDVRARWTATCHAVRAWSVEHPHDYALLYGSPVIDYAAPRDTVRPATRVIVRLVDIISAAHGAEGDARPLPEGPSPSFAPAVGPATAALRDVAGLDVEHAPELVGRTLMAWSTLFGSISFELWGHLVGSVDDYESYFDSVVSRLWHDLGGV